jgi:putative PIG3 family NAD(P)H quinone oxidoreductase
MRTLVITRPGGPEVLSVIETPAPRPIGDQLLVRVRAAGVNRADLMQRAGHYPAPPGVAPEVPGLEYAGVIEAIGPEVHAFSVGQRIFGLVGGGAQAEFLVTREQLAVPVPDRLDDVHAGGTPEAYITAHDALFTQGSLAAGEQVLVHAVGSGVGLAAMQLAKAHGCVVFGTARTPEKLERAKSLGLDVAIDTSQTAFDEVVLALTAAQGVDVVIDFIGGPYLERNLLALGQRGRLVIVSTLGGVSALLSLRTLMTKRLRIVGTMLRSRSYEEKVAATRAFARDVVPLLASAAIEVPVDRTFRLEEAPAAHRYIEENRNFGKVVFDLGA